MLVKRHTASTTCECGVREGGIHALHSVGMCCRYAVALAEASTTTRGRPNNRPLPSGFMVTLSRRGQVNSLMWYGTRTRDIHRARMVLCRLS